MMVILQKKFHRLDFVIIARNLFAFFWEVFASVILVLCAEAFE